MRMAGVLQAHRYFLTRHLLLVICTLREVCRRSDAASATDLFHIANSVM